MFHFCQQTKTQDGTQMYRGVKYFENVIYHINQSARTMTFTAQGCTILNKRFSYQKNSLPTATRKNILMSKFLKRHSRSCKYSHNYIHNHSHCSYYNDRFSHRSTQMISVPRMVCVKTPPAINTSDTAVEKVRVTDTAASET